MHNWLPVLILFGLLTAIVFAPFVVWSLFPELYR